MLHERAPTAQCLWLALLLCILMQFIQGVHLLTEQQQQQQQHQQTHRQSPVQYQQPPSPSTRGSTARWNRLQSTRSPPAVSNNNLTEFKELMENLHDRVSVLATLDEDLRNRLQSIENKIIQFETNNLVRLDSLTAEQMTLLKKMDNMTALEVATHKAVTEMKGDDDADDQQIHDFVMQDLRNESTLNRVTRQYIPPAASASTGPSNDAAMLDISQRLDSLATLLVSAREAIGSLKTQVASNLTRIMQTTSNVQRRFNVLQRRLQHQQQQQQPQFVGTGLYPSSSLGGQSPLVTSCLHAEPSPDGITRLQLTATSEPFYVLCEDNTGAAGTGWIVIQHRFNGEFNFNRGWSDYKTGFGNLAGEFFIGLDKLHALTASSLHELLIRLEDHEGNLRYARYSLFAIGGEKEQYAMSVLGAYTGNAGDSLTYHAGNKFSTFDNDNDGCPDCNCALSHMGGWWYNWCDQSNLNGKYHLGNETVPLYQGIYWHTFNGANSSLKRAQMAIRPVDANQVDQAR